MKRIVICFDGTWNTPNDSGDVEKDANTNVHKLFQAIVEREQGGVGQVKHYVVGVGTRWYNRIRGGAFGVGLDRNIKEGYGKLAELYQDGDEIFVLGFSRGAYSARSLVGMIRNVGLLHRNRRSEINTAYDIYRTRDEGADSPSARTFRERFSREVRIRCLGVWDTVGALGVPLQSFGWFNAMKYQFHDTELSGIVENAFHAVAIDEHRKNYEPTLWAPKHKPNQRMEQVWFSGAHSDVGGGYRESGLSDITLRWMADRLDECALELDRDRLPGVGPENADAPVHDSYALFLKGAYQLVASREFRPLGTMIHGNEALDDSVRQRLDRRDDYRPGNAVHVFLRAAGTNMEGITRLRDIPAGG